MPRPGPRRPLVAIRLSAEGIAHIDGLAAKAGVTRSEMIRTLLTEAVAARQMPTPRARPVRTVTRKEQV